MKVILEASSRFWEAFMEKAGVDKDTAFKSLESVVRRRLELRPQDEVIVRESS